MTADEFVIWMKGFVEGSHAYNLTPAGWDAIKSKLKEVQEFKEWPGMLTTEQPFIQPLTPPQPYPYWYTTPGTPLYKPLEVTCQDSISPIKFYNNTGEETVNSLLVSSGYNATTRPTPPPTRFWREGEHPYPKGDSTVG